MSVLTESWILCTGPRREIESHLWPRRNRRDPQREPSGPLVGAVTGDFSPPELESYFLRSVLWDILTAQCCRRYICLMCPMQDPILAVIINFEHVLLGWRGHDVKTVGAHHPFPNKVSYETNVKTSNNFDVGDYEPLALSSCFSASTALSVASLLYAFIIVIIRNVSAGGLSTSGDSREGSGGDRP